MDEIGKPSSSVNCYRQTATQSVSVIHQGPSPQEAAVIQMQQFDVVGGSTDNLQQPDYTRHEPGLFSGLVEGRVMDQLIEHGGVQGVAATLETHIQNGILDGSSEDINCRKEFFGSNSYPASPPTMGFFHCLQKEFMDFTNIILLVCAALYLVLGIKQKGAGEGWYDGVSIFAAIFLVISVSATSNFGQNRKLDNLFEFNKNILVDVMRHGRRYVISKFEIVVGDIVCLKNGDQVPADGIFIKGSLKVDESRTAAGRDRVEINHENPFLSSGSKIIDGCATMLVTAVGMKTSWGRMMSTIVRDPNEETPLHDRSRKLTLILGMFGLAMALLVLVRLLVGYFTGKTRDEFGNVEFIGSRTKVDDLIRSLVDIIATAVIILVVAIRGGFSLAINLTLAHSTKRMMADQAVVRNLSACEVLASAKTICTDMKRIIASKQIMRVLRFFVGVDSMEGRSYTSIAANVLELFFQGIRHTSAHVHNFFPVTPIDETILSWAVLRWNMEMENIRPFSILNVKPSCSESWGIGISLRNQADNRIHLHWKGDADIILPLCSHYYDSSGNMIALSNHVERERFLQIIEQMTSSRLRCVAFAHRQLSEDEYENEAANQGVPDTNLILLGLLGIEDHCHPGIREAFQVCRRAGIHVKLVTSENVSRARAMVLECGILSPGEEVSERLVVEAQAFFNYTEEEQRQRVGDIMVMAMSSDEHKRQMVQLLKANGHVVAVTGDCANDAPTLQEANVGIAMGEQSTEVAKECSDILILDDNFANVVKVVLWVRCIRNNIQKFNQFQLTANMAFLMMNTVTILSSGNAPLTIAQVLWANLIINTLGALALATDKPTEAVMKQPVYHAGILMTNIMWRNMIAQALYQIAVILTLQFIGESIFGVREEVVATLIFNTFVFCQVFNLVNARNPEEKNVFVGILENRWFIVITWIIVILQVILVEFLNRFFHTERLNWKQWAACIGIAAFTWPFDWLIKCIPVPISPLF